MIPPHRSHEQKAKYAAQRHCKTQEDLDRVLSQFHPRHRQRILDRLTPHLQFEPKALEPKQ